MHPWMKGKVGSWKKPRRIADEAGIVFLPGEEAAGKAERSQHYTGNQHFPSIHGARGKGLGLRSCRERHRGHLKMWRRRQSRSDAATEAGRGRKSPALDLRREPSPAHAVTLDAWPPD